MKLGLDILVGGRSRKNVEKTQATLNEFPGVRVSQRLLVDAETDPLAGIPEVPDLLVLCLSERWADELAALAHRPAAERPPAVVVGQQGDTAVMRAAMRAGTRDFFTYPLAAGELTEVLQQVSVDKYTAGPGGESEITAVIGARGGAGTSMISSNLAHVLTRGFGLRTALVDLDIQFGGLPLFFDMQPSDGLLEAISRVASLDEAAIEGYMLKHSSGVHILGSAPDQITGPGELDESHLMDLLALLKRAYRHVVIDLPRQIDTVTDALTSSAKRVVVVVQPNIPHIKDTKQLLSLLTGMMGVPAHNIIVAANRCDRNSPIERTDLQKIFSDQRLICLANDFPTVSESQNLGKPLYDLAPRSPVTRDLIALSEHVTGSVLPERERRTARRLFGLLG